MRKTKALSAALPLIRVLRGRRVILDADLARLYGVATARLNQQFRRNLDRFPDDFAFILTGAEAASGGAGRGKGQARRNRGKPPIAYTEYGAVMAANVLKSEQAVRMSIEVVRAFIGYRRFTASQEKIAGLLRELEVRVVLRLDQHDEEIRALFGMMAALIGAAPAEASAKKRVGSA